MIESFAEALTELRRDLGVSQHEMQELSGVGRMTLNRYERGEFLPTREQVDRLVTNLQLTVERAARLYLAAGFIPGSPAIRCAVGAQLLRGMPVNRRITIPEHQKRQFTIDREKTAAPYSEAQGSNRAYFSQYATTD